MGVLWRAASVSIWKHKVVKVFSRLEQSLKTTKTYQQVHGNQAYVFENKCRMYFVYVLNRLAWLKLGFMY